MERSRSVKEIFENSNIKKRFVAKYNGACGHLLKTTLNLLIAFIMLICSFGISVNAVQAASDVRIIDGEQWKYFKGTKEPPSKWNKIEFDDSQWEKGKSGFGYGHSNVRTSLKDMRSKYKKVYARRAFSISNPSSINKIYISAICDGPFIAYLNGIEVIRNNIGMPVIEYGAGKGRPLQIEITGFAHELHSGVNVVSFQCENDDMNSENYSFIPFFEIIENE